MSREKLLAHQAALNQCQKVYGVYVTCDGETALTSVWENKFAADLCAQEHNTLQGNEAAYYGKARVHPLPLQTESMARELYSSFIESEGT